MSQMIQTVSGVYSATVSIGGKVTTTKLAGLPGGRLGSGLAKTFAGKIVQEWEELEVYVAVRFTDNSWFTVQGPSQSEDFALADLGLSPEEGEVMTFTRQAPAETEVARPVDLTDKTPHYRRFAQWVAGMDNLKQAAMCADRRQQQQFEEYMVTRRDWVDEVNGATGPDGQFYRGLVG